MSSCWKLKIENFEGNKNDTLKKPHFNYILQYSAVYCNTASFSSEVTVIKRQWDNLFKGMKVKHVNPEFYYQVRIFLKMQVKYRHFQIKGRVSKQQSCITGITKKFFRGIWMAPLVKQLPFAQVMVPGLWD